MTRQMNGPEAAQEGKHIMNNAERTNREDVVVRISVWQAHDENRTKF